MNPLLSLYHSTVRGSPRIVATAMQVLVMLALVASLLVVPAPAKADTIPTFSIVSVVPGESVTIQTYNFPAGQIFTVRMGDYGTLGIGGTVVGTTNSGAGGSFQETYDIPDGLVDNARIAVRMDSPAGFYAYNWFNNVSGGTGGPYPTAVPGSTPIPTTGYSGIPTFSIASVDAGNTVTIQTNNFPANQIFTVRMGKYGTLGIGGTVVGTTNSGAGGSFQETYDIPDALQGAARIAIRMDSPAGYFAYNWFDNVTGGSGGPYPTTIPSTGYTGIPTFSIQSVAADDSVTILAKNFPKDQTFTVRMGKYGTLGIGGIEVATTDSGDGGSFTVSYDIPAELQGQQRIAIRLDSAAGYFAYNWFWNNTSGGTGGPVVTPGPTTIPSTGYTGIPTFSISAVVRDTSVTIQAKNFPKDQTFTVRMGAYGTLGIGGVVVATTDSGDGGAFSATYDIPDSLQGAQRIAIRMESSAGYFAYNWFWNSSTP